MVSSTLVSGASLLGRSSGSASIPLTGNFITKIAEIETFQVGDADLHRLQIPSENVLLHETLPAQIGQSAIEGAHCQRTTEYDGL